MVKPRPGYGKDFAVKWINVANNETMYSGAMTREAAERLVQTGHWAARTFPTLVNLKDRNAQP